MDLKISKSCHQTRMQDAACKVATYQLCTTTVVFNLSNSQLTYFVLFLYCHRPVKRRGRKEIDRSVELTADACFFVLSLSRRANGQRSRRISVTVSHLDIGSSELEQHRGTDLALQINWSSVYVLYIGRNNTYSTYGTYTLTAPVTVQYRSCDR